MQSDIFIVFPDLLVPFHKYNVRSVLQWHTTPCIYAFIYRNLVHLVSCMQMQVLEQHSINKLYGDDCPQPSAAQYFCAGQDVVCLYSVKLCILDTTHKHLQKELCVIVLSVTETSVQPKRKWKREMNCKEESGLLKMKSFRGLLVPCAAYGKYRYILLPPCHPSLQMCNPYPSASNFVRKGFVKLEIS